MGRAIVRNPQVFLMDEPLSNLDAKLRVKMRVDIAALQRRLGVTMLYVTHDQVEAMTMGQRVAVLRDGRLQQCGPPRELYNHPANVFVAGFIGSPAMNLLPARLNGDGVVDLCGMTVPLARELVSGADPRRSGDRAAPGVTGDERLGRDPGRGRGRGGARGRCVRLLRGRERRDAETRLIARTDWRHPPDRGTRVTLTPRASEAHVFDARTGARLGE